MIDTDKYEECKECGFSIDPDNEVYPAGSECICDLKEDDGSDDMDEHIEMWNANLLGSEGVERLMNALIAEVKRLRDLLKGGLE